MSWEKDVSVIINCHCDRCNRSDTYDLDEELSDSEVETYLEGMGWTFKGGELRCEDCSSECEGEDEFLDRCSSCWHHVAGHCPTYKMSCEDVYSKVCWDGSECEHYMRIGGKKNDPPKYKPTDASLDRFIIAIQEGSE